MAEEKIGSSSWNSSSRARVACSYTVELAAFRRSVSDAEIRYLTQ